MAPSGFQHDSRAGDPSYAYLDAGKDAVVLPGPSVSYGASSIAVVSAKITTCVNAESACLGHDGYRVQVNDQLAYVVNIEDWEDEIALGRLELCMNAGALSAQLVFAGVGGYLGGGVADVTVVAIFNGATSAPTSALTIECR
jgi:hypothetical protein